MCVLDLDLFKKSSDSFAKSDCAVVVLVVIVVVSKGVVVVVVVVEVIGCGAYFVVLVFCLRLFSTFL